MNCDSFWSEQNGVCSEHDGFMLKADGSAASWKETLNYATNYVAKQFGGTQTVSSGFLQQNGGVLLLGGAALLLILLMGRRRR